MEKVLKSGKKYEVKELSALEDLLAYQLIGGGFDEKNTLGTAILHRRVTTVLAIVKIDDKPFPTPATLNDVYAFLSTFSKKAWAELEELVDEANPNDDGEEALGE